MEYSITSVLAFDALKDAVAPMIVSVVTAGIVIGAGIWVAVAGWRMFKGMAGGDEGFSWSGDYDRDISGYKG